MPLTIMKLKIYGFKGACRIDFKDFLIRGFGFGGKLDLEIIVFNS